LPATILLLGLVRFAVFYEKLQHFNGAILLQAAIATSRRGAVNLGHVSVFSVYHPIYRTKSLLH
jgi:hypothetical protein